MKRTTILILAMTAVLMLAQTALAVDEIYLEDKALEYDWWYQEYCCMGYGGVTEVVFEDEQLTTFKELGGAGDSTIWTGTYLAGQAFRYAVTGDEDAKQNAIDTVMALHTHLQITGEPGYIARYAAPIEWPFDELYTPSHSRYHFGEGEWEGSYWIGETSRDQYTGWMFGMALAYDFIDDEAIRDLIREDIVEVVDKARAYYWFIIKETGTPSTVAQWITPSMQLDWSLIEAHVTDDPGYWKLYEEKFEQLMPILSVDAKTGFLNRYFEHYGLNLGHQTWFNILRLETDPNRRAFLMDIFENDVRPTVHASHNVFFDYIYLANFGEAAMDYEWTVEDDIRQLEKFPEPPKRKLNPVDMPPCELDPLGEFLIELAHALGLEEIFHFGHNCAEAREIEHRCEADFVWQRNSWQITCPENDNPKFIFPGIDYMTPYWMGRYYNLIPPGNPNADDDDDDDDLDPDDDDMPDRSGDDEGGSGNFDPNSDDDDDDGPLCG